MTLPKIPRRLTDFFKNAITGSQAHAKPGNDISLSEAAVISGAKDIRAAHKAAYLDAWEQFKRAQEAAAQEHAQETRFSPCGHFRM